LRPLMEGRAKVVYGSRFLGGPRRAMLFWHMIANKLLTLATNVLYDTILSDMETCYKLFAVEVIRSQPASGQGCLRMTARPTDPKAAPVVVETPPVWITTPPLAAPAGKLLAISAQVWVPEAITGSVDGLLVFDSLGGPALAERVGPSKGWRRLVLYRIVPPEAAGEPVTVTFALSGLGEARIDDVSVTPLERSAGGTPAALVSTPRDQPAGRGFPSPADLLQPAPLPAAAAAVPPAVAGPGNAAVWPGASLGWPKLNPFAANEPPPGPGGGTIDPFKRARSGTASSP